jgi:hypothetical protein
MNDIIMELEWSEILDNIILPYIEDEFEDGNIFYYQNNSPIHRSRVVRD